MSQSVNRFFWLSLIFWGWSLGAQEVRDYQRDFCQNREALNLSGLEYVKGANFLLVPGFLNDFPGVGNFYFADIERALRRLSSSVGRARVQSSLSIKDNSLKLCRYLESRPGKTILLGHSMGGSIVSHLPVVCPDVFANKVRMAVSIQGTIKGSPIADILFDPDMTETWQNYQRSGRSLYAGLADQVYRFLNSAHRAGMRSFGVSASAERVRQLSQILRKLHFVSSEEAVSRMPWYLQPTGDFLSYLGHRGSGGLVPVENQSLRRGHILHVEGAHHFDFVGPQFITGSRSSCRTALVYETLRILARYHR